MCENIYEIQLDDDEDLLTVVEKRHAWRSLRKAMQTKQIGSLGHFNSLLQINRILKGYVFPGK